MTQTRIKWKTKSCQVSKWPLWPRHSLSRTCWALQYPGQEQSTKIRLGTGQVWEAWLGQSQEQQNPSQTCLLTATEEHTELSQRLLCLLVEPTLVFTATALALRLQRGEPERDSKALKNLLGKHSSHTKSYSTVCMKAHSSPPLESEWAGRLRSWLQPLTQDHSPWEQLDSPVPALSAASRKGWSCPFSCLSHKGH